MERWGGGKRDEGGREGGREGGGEGVKEERETRVSDEERGREGTLSEGGKTKGRREQGREGGREGGRE